MIETLREWFLHGAQLLALLGFSLVGVLSAFRIVYKWARAWVTERSDAKLLGAEYRAWRRLAEGCGEFSAGRSLARRIDTARAELAEEIGRGIREEIEGRLDRPASGTLTLLNRDLIEDSLLIAPALKASDGEVLSIEGAEALRVALAEPRGSVVVGPPGAGKSMLCRTVEYWWLSSHSAESELLITLDPIDFASDYPASQGIGSREWMLSLVERRFFGGALTSFTRRVAVELLENRVRVLIDGLDEVAATIAPSEMHRLLRSWVFQRAALSTVRVSYHESALAGDPALHGVRILHWQEPAETEIKELVVRLCRRIYSESEADQRAATVLTVRDNAPGLCELTHNPLLLSMCASILWRDRDASNPDTFTVYREFVRLSLSRDYRERSSTTSPHVLTRVLAEFAWQRFSESTTSVNGRGAIMAAVNSVPEVPQGQHANVAEAMESCPLLTLTRAPLGHDDDCEAQFYHQSFQDYFIAKRTEAWLRGQTMTGHEYFEHIDTPEVTFFLKEAISKLSAEPAVRRMAGLRLRYAFENALERAREASDERTARLGKFAAGQIGYYLGMFGEVDLQSWLEEAVRSEDDFWVRRACAIGLAFGGHPHMAHGLIDEMQAGIRSGDFRLARKNIGVELGFYGDQPFSRLDPAADVGGESCARLVTRSVLELSWSVESANWRMILFNLLYLSQYRPMSTQSFWHEIRQRVDALSEAIAALASDPEKAKYAEIQAVEDLIATLRHSAHQADAIR